MGMMAMDGSGESELLRACESHHKRYKKMKKK